MAQVSSEMYSVKQRLGNFYPNAKNRCTKNHNVSQGITGILTIRSYLAQFAQRINN